MKKIACCMVIAAFAFAAPAAGDVGMFSGYGPKTGNMVSAGFGGGYSDRQGGFGSAEVSVFHWSFRRNSLFWCGLYGDALAGGNGQRYTFGPEAGFWVIGIDGGPVYDNEDGAWNRGAVFRVFLAIPVDYFLKMFRILQGNDSTFAVIPYVRYGWLRDDDTTREAGILLKRAFEL